MKQFTPVILIALLLFSGCVNQSVKQKDKPAKIIFDTDLDLITTMWALLIVDGVLIGT